MRYGWPERVGGLGGLADAAHRARRDAGGPRPRRSRPVLARRGARTRRSSTSRRPSLAADVVPRLLSGAEMWCQGFSEPDTGSDLASFACAAVPDGDAATASTWVINGQKVWTSLAQYADRCVLLTRTGPVESRHRGITAFFVDMDTPGITVAPIEMLNGVAGVRRGVLRRRRRPGRPRPRRGRRRLGGRDEHPPVRALVVLLAAHRLPLPAPRAAWWRPPPTTTATPRRWATRILSLHAAAGPVARDAAPTRGGRDPRRGDVRSTRCSSPPRSRPRTTRCAASCPASWSWTTAPTGLAWRTEYLYSRAATIYGGTAEVQRNIIARRLLELGPRRMTIEPEGEPMRDGAVR